MYSKLIEKMKEISNPELVNSPMVYELWQDGEVTLTKGQDLFRQRSLHCISSPVLAQKHSNRVNELMFNDNTGGNNSIFATKDNINEVLELMENLPHAM